MSLSVGHEAFPFICLPHPSRLVPCSISFLFICLSGLSLPCPLAMKHFYSFVSQVRCCCCPPFSVGHVACLFICLRWCPPFSSAMQHFYSLVSQVCHCWCPPFSAGHAAFLFICFPGLSLVLPPFSAGHEAFLFICLPCDFFLFVFQVWCLRCCFLHCPLEHLCKGCVTVSGIAFLPHCVTLSALFSFSGNRWMNDRIGFLRRGSDLSVQLGRRAYVRHQKSISCHILRSSCFYFLSSRGQLPADPAA